MAKSPILYDGSISKVRFHLSGETEAQADSNVRITSSDLLRNGLPYPGGVYDAHQGTIDYSYSCQTCRHNKEGCLGHEGSIRLNYPVWNAMGVNDGKKWLKLICFSCGKAIISDESYAGFEKLKRLDEASKIARTGNKKCVHCQAVHPIIKKSKLEVLAWTAEILEDKKQVSKWTLLPHMVRDIFSRISDETVIKLGKHPVSHPRNCILQEIKAPPVTIRPDVRKIGGGKSTNDDLTTMLQVIIKKSDVIPQVLPPVIDQKLEKAIFELNLVCYEMIKAGGEGAMNSITVRLKGKSGRFRKHQMGKRTRNMCRSTIVGDTDRMIDEVGIPMVFARIVQIKEIVQDFNKKRLMTYVQNGRKTYPGATGIIKRGSSMKYGVDMVKDIELDPGDIVFRDIIDGDYVNFNRQPSLAISNISAHRAVVIHDPAIKTLTMNVNACSLYNADFDGDQMNLIISSDITARNEIAELSSVSNWLISHTTSSNIIGQVDDGIISMSELTRSAVKYDKYHAMMLFQKTTFLPDFEPGIISGRECVSKILRKTPVNFTRMTEWYKPMMAPYIKYDPTEIKVIIDQGELKQGILDKKSIGKGQPGGLYHIIANEFGSDKALECIYNTQQLALGHTLQSGYTIGIMDLIISQKAKKEIEEISANIINESRLITEELTNGEIVPPIGKTIEKYFEERQINILSVFDEFTEPILKAINPTTNNLFKLIMTGSKGKIDNMFNMLSSIGQKLINGERIRQKFGPKRVLPYFTRFDMSPAARGYLTNSYFAGMTSVEYTYNAMAARFDLISKALSTSITGEQSRTSIKNLETDVVNNLLMVVKGKNILQFLYGEDALDTRKVERVKFPTVMISDQAFAAAYEHKKYPAEFKIMSEDRQKYRKIFLNIEQINVKELMADIRHMPVDIDRTIKTILRAHEKDLKEPDEKTLDEMVALVADTCDRLAYTLTNSIQEEARAKLPNLILCASWLLKMLVRSYLHPNALVALKITPHILKMIIDRVRLKYSQAIIEPGTAVGVIAAQCFSEPLTQYMLDAHHRSASGGTSKSGMTKAREILGARDVFKLDSPTMLIPVLPQYTRDKAKVQEIANGIEVVIVKQFISSWQIYFEKFGEPVHSKTKHESAMIKEFLKVNPLLTPGDLTKWCIRLVLNKTTMILKNIPLELIITRLRDTFPDVYIVYSPENSKQIIVRIYIRASMYKSNITTKIVETTLKNSILTTIIRGVEGITSASVVKMIRNKVELDGSIVQDDNAWGISTNGTNMVGVFTNEYVDPYQVMSDAIQEVAKVLGIEAARMAVIRGLRNLVECNYRHYLIYADEMTFTGRVTPIGSSGLRAREVSNILLLIGYASPINTMETAAVNSMEDPVTGITGPLLLGSTPRHGTSYNRFYVDIPFVQKTIKRPDDLIDELLL